MPPSVPESTAVRSPDAESGCIVEGSHALTPVQEGMLFHCLAEPAPDLYAIQQRVEIDGSLDVDAFRRAWETVTARHGALRSVFSWEGPGPPRQVVCADVDVEFVVEDLTEASDAEAVVDERFDADLARGFRLDRPPLMRLALFRLADRRHVLCWNQHHLLEDGWSSTLVLSEVFDTYHGLVRGEAPNWAPSPPFSEFSSWVDDHVDQTDEELFWRSHLDGFTAPTRMAAPIPASRERTPVATVTRELDPDGAAALAAGARRLRLTPNAVLLGACAIALSRHLGRSDITVAVVASGRAPMLPGIESMVGMLINTLPLRLVVDEAATAADWLRHVQVRQAELLEHQHTGLGAIERWSELPPNTPLTDSLFAFWGFGADGRTDSGDITYRTVGSAGRTGFPFSIVVEAGRSVRLTLDYESDRVDAVTAEAFLDHYVAILEAAMADPELPVSRLGRRMGHDWLRAFNDTAAARPYEDIPTAIAARVAAQPETVAVEDGQAELSYADVDARSSALAARLAPHLPHPGAPVAVHLPRSAAMVVAMLAVWKAGGAFLPMDRHLPPSRIGYVLEDSEAVAIVTDRTLRAGLPTSQAPIVPVEADDVTDAEPVRPEPVDPDRPAYVMYTSGSTGRPKGVVVSHRNLANYVAWAHLTYGRGRRASSALHTSPGFDLTLTSVFLPLVSGGSIVVYSDDDPRDLAVRDVFADDRVDIVKLTPSHLALLDDELLATSRIQRLVLGGEDLSVGVARSAWEASGHRLEIYNEYGPTEATIGCMVHRFDPSTDADRSVPIGAPIANSRIHLLDREGRPVPVGVAGEIHVAGDGVAIGYLGRPELTAERFEADRVEPGDRSYRTGDLARWRSPGVLEFLGRDDDQLKVRGARIEPGEVEATLEAHPAIAAAAVAAREVGPDDVRLVAYYVPAPGIVPSVTDLRSHLRAHLPEHMVARHLVRVDELPLTANGKLDRSALPQTTGEVESTKVHIEPTTPAEVAVSEAVARLLGIEPPGMADNFFDLGGHSLLAMRLVADLHVATGVRVSPRLVLLDTLGRVAHELTPDDTAARVGRGADAPRQADAGSSVGASAVLFGPGEQPLFGIHTFPPPRAAVGRSVLICPPLGWEYMRTHWALRRIARALTHRGLHVLRFDPSGTGDSAGGVGPDAFDRWIGDIGAAVQELRELAGTDSISVLGARLGATFAVLAARHGLRADRLVLWDPVVDGGAHIDQLERMHADLLAARDLVDPPADLVGDELLGFPYPPTLRRQLREVDLVSGPWPPIPATLIVSHDRSADRRLAEAAGLERQVIPDAGAWDDLASVHAQLLPTTIPSALVEILAGTQ